MTQYEVRLVQDLADARGVACEVATDTITMESGEVEPVSGIEDACSVVREYAHCGLDRDPRVVEYTELAGYYCDGVWVSLAERGNDECPQCGTSYHADFYRHSQGGVTGR